MRDNELLCEIEILENRVCRLETEKMDMMFANGKNKKKLKLKTDTIKKQNVKLKKLQHQLDQQKAMWNELKEFVNKKDLEYYSTLNNIGFNDKSSKFLFAKYNFCGEIKNKIKELEKGSADGNIK